MPAPALPGRIDPLTSFAQWAAGLSVVAALLRFPRPAGRWYNPLVMRRALLLLLLPTVALAEPPLHGPARADHTPEDTLDDNGVVTSVYQPHGKLRRINLDTASHGLVIDADTPGARDPRFAFQLAPTWTGPESSQRIVHILATPGVRVDTYAWPGASRSPERQLIPDLVYVHAGTQPRASADPSRHPLVCWHRPPGGGIRRACEEGEPGGPVSARSARIVWPGLSWRWFLSLHPNALASGSVLALSGLLSERRACAHSPLRSARFARSLGPTAPAIPSSQAPRDSPRRGLRPGAMDAGWVLTWAHPGTQRRALLQRVGKPRSPDAIHRAAMSQSQHLALAVADTALSAVPGVGDAADAAEFAKTLFTGTDRYGRPVSRLDIAILGVATILPFVGPSALRTAARTGRHVPDAVTLAARFGRTVDEMDALLARARLLTPQDQRAIARVQQALRTGARVDPDDLRHVRESLENLDFVIDIAPPHGDIFVFPEMTSQLGRVGAGADSAQEAAIRTVGPRAAGVSRPPRHHVLPQEHRAWFEQRGFVGAHDIDNYTVELEEAAHQAVHGDGNWRIPRPLVRQPQVLVLVAIAVQELPRLQPARPRPVHHPVDAQRDQQVPAVPLELHGMRPLQQRMPQRRPPGLLGRVAADKVRGQQRRDVHREHGRQTGEHSLRSPQLLLRLPPLSAASVLLVRDDRPGRVGQLAPALVQPYHLLSPGQLQRVRPRQMPALGQPRQPRRALRGDAIQRRQINVWRPGGQGPGQGRSAQA